jgi:hypothetical protein
MILFLDQWSIIPSFIYTLLPLSFIHGIKLQSVNDMLYVIVAAHKCVYQYHEMNRKWISLPTNDSFPSILTYILPSLSPTTTTTSEKANTAGVVTLVSQTNSGRYTYDQYDTTMGILEPIHLSLPEWFTLTQLSYQPMMMNNEWLIWPGWQSYKQHDQFQKRLPIIHINDISNNKNGYGGHLYLYLLHVMYP